MRVFAKLRERKKIGFTVKEKQKAYGKSGKKGIKP